MMMELKQFELNDDLLSLLRTYNVISLYLFGSILTDHFTEESDIDLLVEFDEKSPISLFQVMDLKQNLQIMLGRTVDLVEKDSIINPYRRQEILKSSRKIYG